MRVGNVHLLATAKPSFLFAGSEFNEGKRALPAVKLINWWISLIQDFTSSNTQTVKVFLFSPAEDAEGSSRLKKRIANFGSNWCYGFPYASSLLCVDQIPLFEDDPKWRHFQAAILENDKVFERQEKRSKKRTKTIDDIKSVKCTTNVKEFFESIQIRPEFRSDPSTFFVLQFPKKIHDLCDNPQSKRIKSDLASFGMKILSGLTFESELAAKSSSQKITSWLKFISVPSCEIRTVDKKENIDAVKLKEDSGSLVVNSVQTLIKKKSVTK